MGCNVLNFHKKAFKPDISQDFEKDQSFAISIHLIPHLPIQTFLAEGSTTATIDWLDIKSKSHHIIYDVSMLIVSPQK